MSNDAYEERLADLSSRLERAVDLGYENNVNDSDAARAERNTKVVRELHDVKAIRNKTTRYSFFTSYVEKTRLLIRRTNDAVSQSETTGVAEVLADIESRIAAIEALFRLEPERIAQPQYPELIHLPNDALKQLYNGLMYNTSSQDFVVAKGRLPEIPGSVRVVITQNGSSYDVTLSIGATGVSPAKQAKLDEHYTMMIFGDSTTHPNYFDTDTSVIEHVGNTIRIAARMRQAIGGILCTNGAGYKPYEQENIKQFFDFVFEQGQTLLGDGWSVTPNYNDEDRENLSITLTSPEGIAYSLGNVTTVDSHSAGELVLSRQDARQKRQVPDNQDEFSDDLQSELEVINRVIGMLYQYAGQPLPVEGKQMPVQAPSDELLDGILETRVFGHVMSASNTMDSLGARVSQKNLLTSIAERFVENCQGNPVVKPSHVLVYGESGSGKTSLLNGTVGILQQEGIAVFELRGVESAQYLTGEHAGELFGNLQKMFLFLKIHGGALVIHDIDALIGIRPGSEMDTMYRSSIQNLIHKELEALRNHPQVLILANTQYLGAFEESWTKNEQRFGNVIGIERDTDAEDVCAILRSVVDQVVNKDLQKGIDPESFENVFGFQFREVAHRIIENHPEGVTPSNLRKAVGEIFSADGTITRATLIATISRDLEELDRQSKARDEYRVTRLETSVAQMNQRIGQLLALFTQLNTVVAGLMSKVTNGNSQLENELRNVTRRLENVGADLANLTTGIGNTNTLVEEVTNQLEGIERQLAET